MSGSGLDKVADESLGAGAGAVEEIPPTYHDAEPCYPGTVYYPLTPLGYPMPAVPFSPSAPCPPPTAGYYPPPIAGYPMPGVPFPPLAPYPPTPAGFYPYYGSPHAAHPSMPAHFGVPQPFPPELPNVAPALHQPDPSKASTLRRGKVRNKTNNLENNAKIQKMLSESKSMGEVYKYFEEKTDLNSPAQIITMCLKCMEKMGADHLDVGSVNEICDLIKHHINDPLWGEYRVSSVIYSLSLLDKSFNFSLDVINPLVEKLSGADINAFHGAHLLSNCFVALDYFSKKDAIHIQIDARFVDQAILRMLRFKLCDHKYIFILIAVTSRLAERKLLKGSISGSGIMQLLYWLCKRTNVRTAGHITKIISNIALIAEYEGLTEPLKTSVLTELVNRVVNYSSFRYYYIDMMINALCRLTAEGCLNEAVDKSLLMSMLTKAERIMPGRMSDQDFKDIARMVRNAAFLSYKLDYGMALKTVVVNLFEKVAGLGYVYPKVAAHYRTASLYFGVPDMAKDISSRRHSETILERCVSVKIKIDSLLKTNGLEKFLVKGMHLKMDIYYPKRKLLVRIVNQNGVKPFIAGVYNFTDYLLRQELGFRVITVSENSIDAISSSLEAFEEFVNRSNKVEMSLPVTAASSAVASASSSHSSDAVVFREAVEAESESKSEPTAAPFDVLGS